MKTRIGLILGICAIIIFVGFVYYPKFLSKPSGNIYRNNTYGFSLNMPENYSVSDLGPIGLGETTTLEFNSTDTGPFYVHIFTIAQFDKATNLGPSGDVYGRSNKFVFTSGEWGNGIGTEEAAKRAAAIDPILHSLETTTL